MLLQSVLITTILNDIAIKYFVLPELFVVTMLPACRGHFVIQVFCVSYLLCCVVYHLLCWLQLELQWQ